MPGYSPFCETGPGCLNFPLLTRTLILNDPIDLFKREHGNLLITLERSCA